MGSLISWVIQDIVLVKYTDANYFLYTSEVDNPLADENPSLKCISSEEICYIYLLISRFGSLVDLWASFCFYLHLEPRSNVSKSKFFIDLYTS